MAPMHQARRFERHIGIDYSGAKTSDDPLPGLRVFVALGDDAASEVRSPGRRSGHWTRRELAHWLRDELMHGQPTCVGIDHGLSVPLDYWQAHGLSGSWAAFLHDFNTHWDSRPPGLSVDDLRLSALHPARQRQGSARWRRRCEQACRAKSVFHFGCPGSVAKSTHAGLPWVAWLKAELGERLLVWPMEGWMPRAGAHMLFEAYPSFYADQVAVRSFGCRDQFDAYAVATWLATQDRAGRLDDWLTPPADPATARVAEQEGWLLGVPWP